MKSNWIKLDLKDQICPLKSLVTAKYRLIDFSSLKRRRVFTLMQVH